MGSHDQDQDRALGGVDQLSLEAYREHTRSIQRAKWKHTASIQQAYSKRTAIIQPAYSKRTASIQQAYSVGNCPRTGRGAVLKGQTPAGFKRVQILHTAEAGERDEDVDEEESFVLPFHSSFHQRFSSHHFEAMR
jgi:hypothetical protein